MKCSVKSCEKDVHGRGWCRAHYRRWERKGDHQPEVPLRRGICLDTLHEYVDIGDCWEWTRALDQTGYGKVLWQGKRTGGHRAFYELLVGPIPPGLELDHLCRNHRCVNPDHLEAVTHAENMRRSRRRSRHYCRNGHRRTPANTYVWNGVASCRVCSAARRASLARERCGMFLIDEPEAVAL